MTPLLRTLHAVRDRAGSAAVEFAILAPILIGLLVGIVDFGMGIYEWMEVVNAAQAGAQIAVLQGYNSTAIQNAAASASSLTALTASPAQFCGCPNGSVITTVSCGTVCPSGIASGTYVKVSAQTQYATLLPYPGLASPLTLSAQSTVRIQ